MSSLLVYSAQKKRRDPSEEESRLYSLRRGNNKLCATLL